MISLLVLLKQWNVDIFALLKSYIVKSFRLAIKSVFYVATSLVALLYSFSIHVTPCHFYSTPVFPIYRILYSIRIGSILNKYLKAPFWQDQSKYTLSNSLALKSSIMIDELNNWRIKKKKKIQHLSTIFFKEVSDFGN